MWHPTKALKWESLCALPLYVRNASEAIVLGASCGMLPDRLAADESGVN